MLILQTTLGDGTNTVATDFVIVNATTEVPIAMKIFKPTLGIKPILDVEITTSYNKLSKQIMLPALTHDGWPKISPAHHS